MKGVWLDSGDQVQTRDGVCTVVEVIDSFRLAVRTEDGRELEVPAVAVLRVVARAGAC